MQIPSPSTQSVYVYALKVQSVIEMWLIWNDYFIWNGMELDIYCRTSLMAQCLRIHLPVQGTLARSLVWEGYSCHGATKPMYRDY